MRSKIFIAVLLILFIASCKNKPESSYIFLEGFTQGTTFHITYEEKTSKNYLEGITHIFNEIDSSMSIYRKNSIITGINQNDPNSIPDKHFLKVIEKAIEVSRVTNGAFDITVGPLASAWGFGFAEKSKITPQLIDSLRSFVGIEWISLLDGQVIKKDPRVSLDVNAIAKGYTVDVVAEFLEEKGVKNYMVEIGGELRVRGVNPKGQAWRIGVDKPMDDPLLTDRQLQSILAMRDMSMATSGNYRKFYVEDGIKYSHTIDPLTGYPVNHSLLSATVFAEDCMTADAFATAFMTMGLEKTKDFIRSYPGLDVYLIYDKDGETGIYYTEKVRQFMEE
jgi:FAD:protein FMN transferase